MYARITSLPPTLAARSMWFPTGSPRVCSGVCSANLKSLVSLDSTIFSASLNGILFVLSSAIRGFTSSTSEFLAEDAEDPAAPTFPM